MKTNLLLSLSQMVIEYFWQSEDVKKFVIRLLSKYAESTDNDVDDLLVSVVKSKLFKS